MKSITFISPCRAQTVRAPFSIRTYAIRPDPSPLPSTPDPLSERIASSDQVSSSETKSPSAASTRAPAVVQGAPRDLVLSNSVVTSAGMTAAALLFGAFGSPALIQLLHGDVEHSTLLLSSLGRPELRDIIIGLVTASIVSAARLNIVARDAEFANSTLKSNALVLTNLAPLDYLVVACLPAIAEEFVFRHALIPAIAPDFRGVAISAVVFGALHLDPQRRTVFAVWATIIGAIYGALYLSTGSIWAPAVAHAAGNLLSAIFWKTGALKYKGPERA